MVLHFEILWNLEFMSVGGKVIPANVLPVFQVPDSGPLDQRVLDDRALLFFFFF